MDYEKLLGIATALGLSREESLSLFERAEAREAREAEKEILLLKLRLADASIPRDDDSRSLGDDVLMVCATYRYLEDETIEHVVLRCEGIGPAMTDGASLETALGFEQAGGDDGRHSVDRAAVAATKGRLECWRAAVAARHS
ncbi:hypothetical protein HPB52_000706 [Rhipicephalus sanguineus]|uniref:Uncharacterized protein n=1 Tax=Rhipicephalus sanguineus TaxID=34632 RepID=A0A9D4QFX9_RHISA|nr:hypothetical protein HPB52_000706 [Rhipicephalus sanguineus]